MQPISPVIPGLGLPEVVYAKNQPQYNPLPSYRTSDGLVVTRWKLTWRERLDILCGGCLWLQILTFNQPLQPVKIETRPPLDVIEDREGA
jgi:hypothetical protein